MLKGDEGDNRKTLDRKLNEMMKILSTKKRRDDARMKPILRSYRQHKRIHRRRKGLWLLLGDR